MSLTYGAMERNSSARAPPQRGPEYDFEYAVVAFFVLLDVVRQTTYCDSLAHAPRLLQRALSYGRTFRRIPYDILIYTRLGY